MSVLDRRETSGPFEQVPGVKYTVAAEVAEFMTTFTTSLPSADDATAIENGYHAVSRNRQKRMCGKVVYVAGFTYYQLTTGILHFPWI